MKAIDLLKVLTDKEDFEILLYDDISAKDECPRNKAFKLELNDIGYSEKVIILTKVE